MFSSLCPFTTTEQTAENNVTKKIETLKSIDDLPGPQGLPFVGNFLTYLRKENRGQMHLVQEQLHKNYGKMFRERWGTKWQVHVSDPFLIEEICRREGKRPNRPSLQSWLLYRTIHNKPDGIMSAQGDEWYLYRTEFGKRLMCPKVVSKFIYPFNHVLDDFVVALRRLREKEGERGFVSSLPNESYKWSLEMAGTFLFETRLGCLGEQIPHRTSSFIRALQDMLQSSLYLIVGEKFHYNLNTSFWRKHEEAWDVLFEIGKYLIEARLKELELSAKDNSSDNNKEIYLSYCLSNKNVKREQIFTNITELLFAGTETTSNSLCFLLYLMAENREVQRKVFAEVDGVLGGRKEIKWSDLEQMKYVRSVIKENMRLYPIVTMNCRILDEDIVLDGYKIPKKTLFVMNQFASARDEDVFTEAEKFVPERWLRRDALDVEDEDDEVSKMSLNRIRETKTRLKHHPFGCLPFGFGNRSCVGQKVGKMELVMALAKIVQNFEIERYKGVELKPVLRVFLTPGDNVPIVLKDRKQQ